MQYGEAIRNSGSFLLGFCLKDFFLLVLVHIPPAAKYIDWAEEVNNLYACSHLQIILNTT